MNKNERPQKTEEKVHKRHQRIWTFLFHSVGWIFRRIHSYTSTPAPDINKACIILSNHTCELDPVLLALSFKKQMYFVASEHVYRKGWISKLLYWAFEPIAKMKGASDTLTVMKAIRKLRNGYNVCIFAEGSRSFDGRNSPVPAATGKLVKTSGACLVTYRIEGGYLTNPRWGFGLRRGKCHGGVVKVYEAEDLKELSAEQVNEIIVKDIHEDAYERQAFEHIAYKGKNRALGIESAFSICPRCHKLGQMTSEGDRVFCKACGNSSEFNEYGEFSPSFGVKNTSEWEDMQEALFKAMAEGELGTFDSEHPFFFDEGISMKIIDSDHKEKLLGSGKMSLYPDRFLFEPLTDKENNSPVSLLIKDIPDMSVYARNGFVFTDSSGIHYEIKPDAKKSPLNVRKYISIWNQLRRMK